MYLSVSFSITLLFVSSSPFFLYIRLALFFLSLFFSLSLSLSLYLSLYPSIHLFIYLSVRLSLYVFHFLPLWPHFSLISLFVPPFSFSHRLALTTPRTRAIFCSARDVSREIYSASLKYTRVKMKKRERERERERERGDGKGNEPRGKRRVAISLFAGQRRSRLQEGRFTQSANVCSAFYSHESVPPAQDGTIVSSGRGNSRFSRTRRNLGGIRPFICRTSSNRIKQNARGCLFFFLFFLHPRDFFFLRRRRFYDSVVNKLMFVLFLLHNARCKKYRTLIV